MELWQKLEAALFWKGEPLSIAELMRIMGVSSGEVRQGLRELEGVLSGRGIALVRTDNEVTLATAPELHELIERLHKEELSGELGKAAFETLAIVLYKGPVSRRDIEYIRGVNSTSILRTLLIRGLIERKQNEGDDLPAPQDGVATRQAGRVFLYRATIELLSRLGLKSAEELPDFAAMRNELAHYAQSVEREEAQQNEAAGADLNV